MNDADRPLPALQLMHKDGVAWFDRPIPRRWHRCVPSTSAVDGRLVERCACGSTRLDGYGPWMERNSRRKAANRRSKW